MDIQAAKRPPFLWLSPGHAPRYAAPMRSILPLLALSLALTGCGPALRAEAIAGRTIMITNDTDETLTIRRIVANDSAGRSECVDQPGATLSPQRSYTTTFFYCDEVRAIEVETDQGNRRISFD